MITIDGSFGEGGGQILRSSLALAVITGQDLRVEDIRAGRRTPGLKRQHVTAVQAARSICGGRVVGDQTRSPTLSFYPDTIRAGDYTFRVGTAGSTSLVLQTVLLPLLFAAESSRVRLEGGTHNPLAPPFDYLQQVYFPQIKRMGADVRAEIQRHGFYPAGGGRVCFDVSPLQSWHGLSLVERGKLTDRRVSALVSKLPRHIAERELDLIRRRSQWSKHQFHCVEIHDALGPGNVVMIQLNHQYVVELFIAFGEKGLPAEKVAQRVLRQAQHYLQTAAPVGEYLADQLLLPMALAAHRDRQRSEFVTNAVSGHTVTHMHLIQQFLEVSIECTELGAGLVKIEVASTPTG